MYQEHILSYKHLDEPLDGGRFVFECILAGNLWAFTTCSWSLSCSRCSGLYSVFFWLNLFPRNSLLHVTIIVYFFVSHSVWVSGLVRIKWFCCPVASFLVTWRRGHILGIALNWRNPKLINADLGAPGAHTQLDQSAMLRKKRTIWRNIPKG